ncbi:MAG TPA: hypothetical protein DDX40_02740 [Rikenellaceae bacterium]|nr:hypothetical protein [Rikenellaceae bacterium]
MQEKRDIFNGIGKAAFKVPEGYFEGLKARLDAIPATPRTLTPVQRMKPYLALAACFLSFLLVGNAVLKGTTEKSSEGDLYNEFAYAALLRADEYLHPEADTQDTVSNDDVVNYLIDSGTPAELIEYAGLIAKK